MVTVVNNTVLYTCILYLKVAKRVDPKCSHHWWGGSTITCEVMHVLTNLIVVIISQCIHVSNHHVVHLKLTQLNVNYIGLAKKFIRVFP